MSSTVFTTGRVAKLLKVAPRTVSKWFDAGRFSGAYRLPGSQDRRIPKEALMRFLKENGVPIPDELYEEEPTVLTVGLDEPTRQLLVEAIELSPIVMMHAGDLLEAGIELAKLTPKVIVLDCFLGTDVVERALRRLPSLAEESKTIVLASEDNGCRTFEGAADVFRRPFDVGVLGHQLLRFTSDGVTV